MSLQRLEPIRRPAPPPKIGRFGHIRFEARNREIIGLYLAGDSFRDIAASSGQKLTTVRGVIDRFGFPRRRPR